ncbi:MAG: ABC-F family ATP-binding cassette domain-containing protein [Anaerovoracaceae bacterium]
MAIISVKGLSFGFSGETLLKDISFQIEKGDRVGLLGENGTGKTTLLKILNNDLPKDEGDIFISSDISLGYLEQQVFFKEEGTVLSEAKGAYKKLIEKENLLEELSLSLAGADHKTLQRFIDLQEEFEREGGLTYKGRMKGILDRMGFYEDSYNVRLSQLSGGERSRLSLSLLLMKEPDLLLLDEPTNHLDLKMLEWLQEYLLAYKGTFIVVTHDRYFLDKVTNKIFEIDEGHLEIYEGGYEAYADLKREKREQQIKKASIALKEYKRQEDIIRKLKEGKKENLSKRGASREKMLSKLERPKVPKASQKRIKINFHQEYESGREVISLTDISKGYVTDKGYRELFKGLNLEIKRGERICLIGPNGSGKTTLLKIILGEVEKDKGYIRQGHNVSFGYYDQGQQLLKGNNTVLKELKEEFRSYTDTEMRTILGSFLFSGDKALSVINTLSGGERARLSLLKLMLGGKNTLLLDEPTNHLDITSKEIFEDALLSFQGTVLAISHDRYFLNKIPDRIIELSKGGLNEYLGAYDYYLEKKRMTDEDGPIEKKEEEVISFAQESRLLKKEKDKTERRLKREIKDSENKLKALEEEKADIMAKIENISKTSDYDQFDILAKALITVEDSIHKAYEIWLEKSETLAKSEFLDNKKI